VAGASLVTEPKFHFADCFQHPRNEDYDWTSIVLLLVNNFPDGCSSRNRKSNGQSDLADE